MPTVAITSAYGRDYKEPHERKDGPWEEHEIEHCAHCLARAEEIKSNPKLMRAISKHHRERAEEHERLAEGMQAHMKRGAVSEKGMARAREKRHG